MSDSSVHLTPDLPAYIFGTRIDDAWTAHGLLVELALGVAPALRLSHVRFGDALPNAMGGRLVARCQGACGPLIISDGREPACAGVNTHLWSPAEDVQLGGKAGAAVASPAAAVESVNEATDAAAIGLALKRLGVTVESSAIALRSIRTTGGQLVASVVLPERANEDVAAYTLHPLFVDATFHLSRIALSRLGGPGSAGFALRWSRIAELVVEQPGACVASIQLSPAAVQGGRTGFDARLLDASERVVAEILGVTLAPEAELADQAAALLQARIDLAIARAVSDYRAGDDLLASGATSLDLIRIASNLEEELGWSPGFERLVALGNSQALADYYARVDARDETARVPRIPALLVGATAPLSFAQEQLWFLHCLDPQSARYHIHLRVRWRGRIDLDVLAQAAEALEVRHAALHTRIDTDGGEPTQRIGAHGRPRPRIQLLELAEVEPARRTQRVRAELLRMQYECFDLRRGPLYRIVVIASSPDQYLIGLTFHHLIADGRSIEIYARELLDLYADLAVGVDAHLPPIPVSYADYARWQRQHVSDGHVAVGRAYFRRQLAAVPRLHLPATETVTDDAGQLSLQLESTATEALRRLARSEQTTLFVVLCAAYAHVLRCISGQDDFGIGSPALGRHSADLDRVIGLFTNSVVLRVQLEGCETFRAVLCAARAAVHKAIEHHDVPFAKVVEDVCPARSAGDNPLFRAGILFQSWTLPPAARLPGIELEWEWDRLDGSPAGTSRFDLELSIAEIDAALRLEFVHRRRALSDSTAQFVARQLVAVLELAAADPACDLRALVPLAEARRKRAAMLQGPRVHYDAGCGLHLAIERACARNPERVAVSHAQAAITYGELDARSNRLARVLQQRGVTPETRVAICLPRGIEMVTAVIAVLKAGGAYVPLDPHHPVERRRWMLVDSGAKLLITDRQQAGLPSAAPATLLVDESAAQIGRTSPAAVTSDARGDHLAYVMYTSGSTGTPKGVMVEHRNVSSFFAGMDERIPASSAGTWLAATTLAFDISVLELLWTLSREFKVVIADSVMEICDQRFRGVSHFQCTPSIAGVLARDPAGQVFLSGVPHLLIGGEPLTPALAETLLTLSRGTLTNMYGPTETTVWSSSWRFQPGATSISLGDPIANTSFYVLDERRKPVAWGQTGELYIAGDGVARGYHDRSEETNASFSPDPYLAGSRMYKTGDTVRACSDGSLVWTGRADRQVKIAGNRIELGEIEAALARTGQVQQCAVIVHASDGNASLCAFVVPKRAARDLDGDRQFAMLLLVQLRAALPSYMLPSIVVRDSLELTPNGKVDLQALSKAEGLQAGHDAVDDAPRSARELLLSEVWAGVLGRPVDDVTANFFTLGGSSMGVIRVCLELQRRGLVVPPARIFEHPSIASLARMLDDSGAPFLDLGAEAVLAGSGASAPELPAKRRSVTSAGSILLTGATGFVGSHLLAQLVEQSDAPIVCLVRARDRQHGRERLEQALARQGLAAELAGRVEVIPGDLTCDGLGCRPAQLQALGERVDSIIHDAAQVNFIAPYSELRAANVEATRRLIEFAAQGRPKTFHHISTLAVVEACPERRAVVEDDSTAAWRRLKDGYCQSKWVAEQMVRNAVEHGLKASIYRLGVVVGSHANGKMPREEAFVRVLRTVIRRRSCFTAGSQRIDHLSPVDDVARLVVRLSLGAEPGRTFHVAHPGSLAIGDLLEWTRAYGYLIDELPAPAWFEALRRSDDYAEVFPVARRIESGFIPKLDCSRTEAAILELGDAWRPVDGTLYRKLLDALVADGAIEAPSPRASRVTSEYFRGES